MIARAIASVLNQTLAQFELIVVDDGSSDNTEAVISKFSDARLRYVRAECNKGAGAARNAGIRMTESDLVAFQDSDDEWMPSKLEKQVPLICNDIGVVYSDMLFVDRNENETLFEAPAQVNSHLVAPSGDRWAVQNIGIQTTLIRRDLLLQVGCFNESLPALEDLELLIRLRKATAFRKCAPPMVRYYDSGGISSDRVATASARKTLLSLYGAELHSDKGFVAHELKQVVGLELFPDRHQ